ncbi:hypothetical protein AB1Y20_001779 [Prymnesium parvum]
MKAERGRSSRASAVEEVEAFQAGGDKRLAAPSAEAVGPAIDEEFVMVSRPREVEEIDTERPPARDGKVSRRELCKQLTWLLNLGLPALQVVPGAMETSDEVEVKEEPDLMRRKRRASFKEESGRRSK